LCGEAGGEGRQGGGQQGAAGRIARHHRILIPRADERVDIIGPL
jgi:hypothetical protein